MTAQARARRGWLLSGDFGRFWLGQTISNLGSSFTFFALPLLVFKLTGSPINLGVTTACEFVPYLLFGLVIGAWVDRVDRKRLMIATDLARAAVIATIPLLAAVDQLSVGWVYGIAFASATLTIAFDAAEFAAIPSLVPSGDDLVSANGRVQASYSAAQIAGPLLAGLLITVAPVQQVLWVDAASFLVSAGTLLLIGTAFNSGRPEGEQRRAIRREVVDGLRYVLGHPVLRNISAMMALINLVGATVYAQLVVFAKRQLAASDSRVALLYAAGSAGVVLLSLAAGPIRRRLSFSVAALGALLVDGLLTVVLAATRWYWAALVLWAAISGLGIFFNINTSSLRQQIVPNHLLGRVMSIAGVLAWSAIPVGALAGGWAVERTGSVALVYGVIGAVVALLYAAGSVGVVLLSLAAGPVRRQLPFSVAALGALTLDGLLTMVLAATRWYWAALALWAAISGLGIFFNVNTVSLRQQIVPNHLLGRVISIAGVLAWSAIPVGALAGGWAVERTGSVALVYGVIGALVALLALAFSFGPLGHADRYLPAGQPEPADTP